MDYNALKKIWKQDEAMSFKGWDFSYLKHRWQEEPLPWNYEEIIRAYLKPEYRLLDMGTGGGEFLLTLNHPYHNTSVTEMWAHNVKVCQEKLSHLGIEVKQILSDDDLPFNDNTFDLIINRHDSYDVKEIKRILKPDGLFITQQVGGRNNIALSKKLIQNFKPQYEDNNIKFRANELEEKGFKVLKKDEHYPYLRFYDVGAIVYFAKIIPWEFPDFSVDKCFRQLVDLQSQLEHRSYIESLEHRFILVCQSSK